MFSQNVTENVRQSCRRAVSPTIGSFIDIPYCPAPVTIAQAKNSNACHEVEVPKLEMRDISADLNMLGYRLSPKVVSLAFLADADEMISSVLLPATHLQKDHQDRSVPCHESQRSIHRRVHDGEAGTHAAVAARTSNGFAIVALDNNPVNNRMNPVIIPSRFTPSATN
jgi:hypothetical protein